MRTAIISIWLCILAAGITSLFWYNEWLYLRPTPVPANYHPVSKGTAVSLPAQVKFNDQKPVFIHFFNPDCPCSRFNMPHFRQLVQEYGANVDFAIVVLNNKKYTAKQIQEKFNLTVPVSFDSSVAAACGVYSTPQAVILDSRHQLYYRGNYNKSRYCTDKRTNYAQLALDDLLMKRFRFQPDPQASTAYGCQLPECTK